MKKMNMQILSGVRNYIPFRNLFFTVVLLSLIFISTGWHVFSYLGDKGVVQSYSSQEFFDLNMHERAWYEGPFGGNFNTGFFQERLEKASADHFPLPFLLGYMTWERELNNLFLSVLPVTWAPVAPAGGDILSLREENRLISIPQHYIPEELDLLTTRARYYNELAEQNPDVRFFVFPIMPAEGWLAMSKTFWAGSQDILAADKWVIAFESLLSSKVSYSWAGEGLSSEEGVSLYYSTDHHFVMPSAYEIYKQLIELLGKSSEVEYRVLDAKDWFAVPNVKFRGGHARLAGAFDSFYDVLEDADFGLPLFQVDVNASKEVVATSTSLRDSYKEGVIPKGDFVRHYANYYGLDHGLIHYICESAPDRNLLVLADSFDNTITPLLSAHYRQSFFVDPRYYDDMMKETFELEEFIKKHNINDVIFFGRQRRVLGFVPMDN